MIATLRISLISACNNMCTSSHFSSDVSIVPYEENINLKKTIGAWPTIAPSLTTPTAYLLTLQRIYPSWSSRKLMGVYMGDFILGVIL